MFPALFDGPMVTPLDPFLTAKTGGSDPWQALRQNSRTVGSFVKACHQRLDGLRILQFVKQEYRLSPSDDRQSLVEWLERHGGAFPDEEREIDRWGSALAERDLTALATAELDGIRRMLFRMEDRYRREDYHRG